MSAFSVKPKVYRLPKAQPSVLKLGYQRAAELAFNYKQYAYMAIGTTALVLLVLGQSFVVSSAPVGDSGEGRRSFTFFAPSDSNAAPPDQPFVINGKNQTIVGQITEMSSDSRELANIKGATEVDIRANKDLLSVVNKY